MRQNVRTWSYVVIVLLALGLVACGGSSSGGGGKNVQLSGTVATGAPLASVEVKARDANGSIFNAITGADGSYIITMKGAAPPLLLNVPTASGNLFSVATAEGTANIHPFTDMIVRNWFKVQGTDADTAFNAAGAMPSPPTATEVAAIESVVKSILGPFIVGAGLDSDFNMLTDTFTADSTGFDLVLDSLNVSYGLGSVTVASVGSPIPLFEASENLAITNVPVAVVNTIGDVTAPSVPGTLATIRPATNTVLLTWAASTDAVGVAGYRISNAVSQIAITDQTFFLDSASPASNSCYTVVAFDLAGNASAASNQICDSTGATGDVTAPAAASSLNAAVVNATTIDLTWTAATDAVGVMAHKVYANGILVAEGDGAYVSFTHTGLKPGTRYTYEVWAIDTSGNATKSASASATTTERVVAAWTDGTHSTSDPLALTFYDNGFYIHYMGDTDPNCPGGGLEYGTYVHNAGAQTITFTTIFDGNMSCGLSGDSGVTIPAVQSGDLLSITFTDMQGVPVVLKRVDGGSGSIVGGWGEGYASTSSPMVLTFYPDGFYINYSDGSDPNCLGGGVEYGTYTYNPVTKALIPSVALDNNGTCGLSDNIAAAATYAVSNDTLTVIDIHGTDVVQRVK